MNKLIASVASAAAIVLMASAPATAGDTTQTGFSAVAQLPVTALSSSEMAETRGAGDTSIIKTFNYNDSVFLEADIPTTTQTELVVLVTPRLVQP